MHTARVVSYDEISASTLQEIMEFEKKTMANQVRGMLAENYDDITSSPGTPSRSPAVSPSPAMSRPEKKPLRAGRRKTGDAVTLTPPRVGTGMSPLPTMGSKTPLRPLTSKSSGQSDELGGTTPRTSLPSADNTPKQKKPLRTGRKKVSITATGDLQPIVGPPLTSEMTTSSSKSSIEILDEIMRKLDDKEVQAAQRSIAVKEDDSPHVTDIQSCGCSVM